MDKVKAAQDKFSLKSVLQSVQGELILGNPQDSFSGVSIDSRTVKKGDIFIAIKGNRLDGHNFIGEALSRGAECIIAARNEIMYLGSDKLPRAVVTVKDTLLALADLAYYHRKRFGLPVIGITGSNGKTTTKDMLSCLLSSKYKVLKNEGTQNNIIGLSLTLLRLDSSYDLAVLELGTNHFGEIRELARVASPNVGIITNIGPAHLEFLGDELGVLREKWSLIEELAFPRIAVINFDDPLLREKLSRADSGDTIFFTFGLKNKCDWTARRISCRNKKVSFLIKNYRIDLKTASKVNAYNALAGFAAARLFSLDAYDIINKFREFQFPRSRFQVKSVKGLNVVDDAYNANPVSLSWAIEAFSHLSNPGRKIAVIGDMLELGDQGESWHRKIGQDLSNSRVDFIIGVGRLSHIACDAALTCGFNSQAVHKCFSVIEARNIIFGLAKRGDNVLIKGSRAMRLEEIFNR